MFFNIGQILWICRFYPVSVIHQTIENRLKKTGRSIVDASMVCMAAGRSPGFFYAEIMDVFYFEMASGNVLY